MKRLIPVSRPAPVKASETTDRPVCPIHQCHTIAGEMIFAGKTKEVCPVCKTDFYQNSGL